MILVQVTILSIICARFENFPMSNFCMTSFSKVLVFINFVYNPMGASTTGSTPTTIYILMHNFIVSYCAGFDLSLLKRAKKLSLIWYQTYLDMWSIFGVKLNYIAIFEKSCNSSTLLMELFMICGHMWPKSSPFRSKKKTTKTTFLKQKKKQKTKNRQNKSKQTNKQTKNLFPIFLVTHAYSIT